MKNAARSVILKAAVFVIFLSASGVMGYLVSQNLITFDTVYRFENSFNESEYLSHVMYDFVITYLSNSEGQSVTAVLNEFPVEYTIIDGDSIFSNNGETNPGYYLKSKYMYVYLNGNENTDLSYQGPTPEKNVTFMIKFKEDYISKLEPKWETQKYNTEQTINYLIILAAVMLLAFIYFMWVCGRTASGDDIHLLLIDRMYVEFNIFILCFLTLGAAALIIVIIDEILYSRTPELLKNFIPLIVIITAAADLGLMMSLIRNLKNKTFLKRSAIRKILILSAKFIRYLRDILLKMREWCMKKIQKIFSYSIRAGRRIFADKIGRAAGFLIIAYSAALIFLMLLALKTDGTAIVLPLALIAFSVIWTAKKLSEFDILKEGIHNIRNGNLGYKIELAGNGFLSSAADDINCLREGMAASLEKEMKSERMKSELITNVSHDLKTPLTSIINYSELLCREKLVPEEANDYAKIINQKSLRLKNLTSDLFDISKVQSGNEVINMERIDLCLLINQTLGEHNSEIESSGLEFITSFRQDEIFIMGDGKKLSRVFENLIGNAVKYSMNKTRVYINAALKEKKAVIEIKNISSYRMDFDEEEITERFVRGDKARSSEGNGLGLAIAKSFVSALNGKLEIKVDGDLFKVIIEFPTAE